jgi:hypothetical protein
LQAYFSGVLQYRQHAGFGSEADFRLWRLRPEQGWSCVGRTFNLALVEFGVNSSGLSLKLQAELEQTLRAIDARTATLAARAQTIELTRAELQQKLLDIDSRTAELQQASLAEANSLRAVQDMKAAQAMFMSCVTEVINGC